jgi:general L-amino acid transport system ATP-binding protein
MIGINKWFGDFHVLRDINLKVMKGERIVICGPSGSGKSTMIRCINRLEEHQKGKIVVDGIELTNDLNGSTKCAARSAWFSSTSTCSRTSRSWRI